MWRYPHTGRGVGSVPFTADSFGLPHSITRFPFRMPTADLAREAGPDVANLQAVSMSTITWESLPEHVTGAVQERTGHVVKAEPAPGLAAVLHAEDGTRWFLKAAPEDNQAYRLYDRELSVSAGLPLTAPAPRMRWATRACRWSASTSPRSRRRRRRC